MKLDFLHPVSSPDAPTSPETAMRGPGTMLFGRQVSRSTLLITSMFLLGAGWVLWESLANTPKPAAADSSLASPNLTMGLNQMRLEAVIGKARQARVQQLLQPFRRDEERRHLRLHPLPRDPFEDPAAKEQSLPTTLPATAEPAPPPEEPPPPVEQLELNSVLIGATPTAIINGYLLQEGQTIDRWKVAKILPGQVLLRWRNHEHVLKMP